MRYNIFLTFINKYAQVITLIVLLIACQPESPAVKLKRIVTDKSQATTILSRPSSAFSHRQNHQDSSPLPSLSTHSIYDHTSLLNQEIHTPSRHLSLNQAVYEFMKTQYQPNLKHKQVLLYPYQWLTQNVYDYQVITHLTMTLGHTSAHRFHCSQISTIQFFPTDHPWKRDQKSPLTWSYEQLMQRVKHALAHDRKRVKSHQWVRSYYVCHQQANHVKEIIESMSQRADVLAPIPRIRTDVLNSLQFCYQSNQVLWHGSGQTLHRVNRPSKAMSSCESMNTYSIAQWFYALNHSQYVLSSSSQTNQFQTHFHFTLRNQTHTHVKYLESMLSPLSIHDVNSQVQHKIMCNSGATACNQGHTTNLTLLIQADVPAHFTSQQTLSSLARYKYLQAPFNPPKSSHHQQTTVSPTSQHSTAITYQIQIQINPI